MFCLIYICSKFRNQWIVSPFYNLSLPSQKFHWNCSGSPSIFQFIFAEFYILIIIYAHNLLYLSSSPKMKIVCDKKILDFLVVSINEVSNPNQGGEVSLHSSCYWGIGGYFFPFCLFPFMLRCIPFPSLLIIPWQAFIISLYLSLVICLRSFFLSHSCFLQSFD